MRLWSLVRGVMGEGTAQGPQQPHQRAPGAEEGAIVQQGGLSNLRERVHSILGIHMAQQHPQPVCPLQLLDPPIDVLWVEQVIPARQSNVGPRITCPGHIT